MSHVPHWIKTELSRHFEDIDLEIGVDFNRDGVIDGTERTDFDGNGVVETDEWRRFLIDNESSLRNLGGFFNYYYDYGRAFKPDNPIHDLFFIESNVADESEIAAAYEIVENIYNDVVNNLGSIDDPAWENINGALLFAFRNHSITYGVGTLLTKNITNGLLDCDTWSDVVIAIAHEINWPVSMVNAPSHTFVRYNDEGLRYNLDQGIVLEDDDYISEFSIARHSVVERTYLDELDYNSLVGFYYANIGGEHVLRENYETALNYLNMAIELYSNHVSAYCSRGFCKEKLGDYVGAIEDYNKAIELDPNCAHAYHFRGVAREKIEDYASAIEDYSRAIELYLNYVNAHENIAIRPDLSYVNEYFNLGSYTDAIADYNSDSRRDLYYVNAYYFRGRAREKIEDYAGAIEDYNKVIELKPDFYMAYSRRGELRLAMEDTIGAVRDLERAVDLDTTNNEYLLLRLFKARMLYWNSLDMGRGPF